MDVHEFEADRSGVGLLQRRDHLAQLHLLAVAEEGIRGLAVEIRRGESELLDGEPGIPLGGTDRIDVRLRVAERPVVVHQAHDLPVEGQIPSGRGGLGSGRRPPSRARLGGAEFESLEEGRPRGFHRLRILGPAGILFLENFRVEAGGDRRFHWLSDIGDWGG